MSSLLTIFSDNIFLRKNLPLYHGISRNHIHLNLIWINPSDLIFQNQISNNNNFLLMLCNHMESNSTRKKWCKFWQDPARICPKVTNYRQTEMKGSRDLFLPIFRMNKLINLLTIWSKQCAKCTFSVRNSGVNFSFSVPWLVSVTF